MAAHDTSPLVLVVDDEADAAHLLGTLFELEGYRVTMASDGVEALGVFRLRQPDIVVTDYRMPRMDGLQLIRSIRGEPNGRFLPIVLLSGDMPSAWDQQEEPSASFAKPFSAEALLNTALTLLAGRRGNISFSHLRLGPGQP